MKATKYSHTNPEKGNRAVAGSDQPEISCCSDTCCCDTTEAETKKSPKQSPFREFSITIDDKAVVVKEPNRTIVEIAKDAKIAIPAPCFLANRQNGCCNACIVEIDGKLAFACGTRPKEGMRIVIKRDDLKLLRKQKLLKYMENIKNGTWEKCECS